MNRSILVQLARDSIQEVFEAKRTIVKQVLLQTHPMLAQPIATQVNIFLQGELRGTSKELNSSLSLLESVIKNAKKAAFEDSSVKPLTTSEYLHCEVEVVLFVDGEVMKQRDNAIIDDRVSLESIL